MIKITVIGCGALGSVFVEELAKRSNALPFELAIQVCDFDTVESRNCASQNFSPSDIGKPKAEVLSDRLRDWPTLEVLDPVVAKISMENFQSLIQPGFNIVVDLVDNIPTRQMIWLGGKANQVPTLHVGMDQAGMGMVDWAYKDHDMFVFKEARQNVAPISLPPCELTGFRSLIFNTAMAGVEALFLFLGWDPSNALPGIFEEGRFMGTVTSWITTRQQMQCKKEFTEIVEFDSIQN